MAHPTLLDSEQFERPGYNIILVTMKVCESSLMRDNSLIITTVGTRSEQTQITICLRTAIIVAKKDEPEK